VALSFDDAQDERWTRKVQIQDFKEEYMTEIEWWDYDDADEMAAAVAGDIQFIIESAIDARGSAVIALAGGNTPLPAYKLLAEAKLDWKKVTIIPGDERIVPLGDPLSNVTALAKIFLPKGARVKPIVPEATKDYKAAGRSADALMQDLHWPLDFCLLGVGTDGHTASIFPGPDYEEAVAGPKERRALGVMPDPLPPEAPVARVTLSREAIVTARAVMIAVTGQAKRDIIEKAIKQGPLSEYPIGRVLADVELPIDIHWAA
jgi:6-phosphogluconolactonase